MDDCKYEYWKDPRLDDEGTYDYLVEELPKDHAEWDLIRCRCDNCGKHRMLNYSTHHYFYCWDGWDNMDWTECWLCMARSCISRYRRKFNKKCKIVASTIGLHMKSTTKVSWKNCYQISKMINK